MGKGIPLPHSPVEEPWDEVCPGRVLTRVIWGYAILLPLMGYKATTETPCDQLGWHAIPLKKGPFFATRADHDRRRHSAPQRHRTHRAGGRGRRPRIAAHSGRIDARSAKARSKNLLARFSGLGGSGLWRSGGRDCGAFAVGGACLRCARCACVVSRDAVHSRNHASQSCASARVSFCVEPGDRGANDAAFVHVRGHPYATPHTHQIWDRRRPRIPAPRADEAVEPAAVFRRVGVHADWADRAVWRAGAVVDGHSAAAPRGHRTVFRAADEPALSPSPARGRICAAMVLGRTGCFNHGDIDPCHRADRRAATTCADRVYHGHRRGRVVEPGADSGRASLGKRG